MLNDDMAHELVFMECERHGLNLEDEQVKMLLQRTGGLPLAIIRTIGRMAWRGSTIQTEIQQLNDAQNQIYDFCFSKTIALIRPGNAYQMFLTLAVFAIEARREALGYVSGFGDDMFSRDEALSDLEVLSLCTKNKDRFGLEALTRAQALSELHSEAAFERDARERWERWYISFTEEYGGIDQQEMHVQYDNLEEDWDNVLAAINWCIDQAQYDNVVTLWQNVRDFTHIYGYWTDRVKLLNWIISKAEARGDWQVAIQAMYDKAFTLSLTGPSTSLEEADLLLQRCWSMRDQASEVLLGRIAALISSVCIQHTKHQEAHQWLDTSEAHLQAAKLDATTLARERASILYDRGENWFAMGDYVNSQRVFEEMLEQAQASNWQRSVVYALNWLAYTAVLNGRFEAAEHYLQTGWPIATRNKEKRVNAYYRRTFAYYYRGIGNQIETARWAEAALDNFERLGMLAAAAEMRLLVNDPLLVANES
jgi:LuxR family glucitol operon transcriptional activator